MYKDIVVPPMTTMEAECVFRSRLISRQRNNRRPTTDAQKGCLFKCLSATDESANWWSNTRGSAFRLHLPFALRPQKNSTLLKSTVANALCYLAELRDNT